MKKSPTDTSKEFKEAPAMLIAEMMAVGTSASINNQESCGQAELVNSEVLPTDGIELLRKTIEGAGGKLLEKVEGDEMFTNVILPDGWKKQATDHAMHSDVIDDKGRLRASMFYKAAFYDRSAHISPKRRFGINRYGYDVDGEIRLSMTDAMSEIEFYTDIEKVPENETKWQVIDRLEQVVVSFMEKNFPDWRSAEAYWD